MARQRSYGICDLCGVRKAKAAMVAHVKQCLAATAGSDRAASVALLRIQDRNSSAYWMTIAAKPEMKLSQVDALLRYVWLECCGHISEFHDGVYGPINMKQSIKAAFGQVGERIDYIYDFGSSTELDVSFAGLTGGISLKAAVVARNEPLQWTCSKCPSQAVGVCCDCREFACAKQARDHNCGEDMLSPVVNSPRMRVCGYTG